MRFGSQGGKKCDLESGEKNTTFTEKNFNRRKMRFSQKKNAISTETKNAISTDKNAISIEKNAISIEKNAIFSLKIRVHYHYFQKYNYCFPDCHKTTWQIF